MDKKKVFTVGVPIYQTETTAETIKAIEFCKKTNYIIDLDKKSDIFKNEEHIYTGGNK